MRGLPDRLQATHHQSIDPPDGRAGNSSVFIMARGIHVGTDRNRPAVVQCMAKYAG